MQAILDHIIYIESQINSCSGSIVIIELKLRLLAESNGPFKKEVYKLINQKNINDKRKNEYWNCDSYILCDSLISTFGNNLDQGEKKAIDSIKNPRNKTLHASFVEFMLSLNVPAEGQEILTSGKRNPLKPGDIKQSIIRFENNKAINELKQICITLNNVIDRLLLRS